MSHSNNFTFAIEDYEASDEAEIMSWINIPNIRYVKYAVHHYGDGLRATGYVVTKENTTCRALRKKIQTNLHIEWDMYIGRLDSIDDMGESKEFGDCPRIKRKRDESKTKPTRKEVWAHMIQLAQQGEFEGLSEMYPVHAHRYRANFERIYRRYQCLHTK